MLLSLEAEGPGVGAGGFDAVLREDAGSPGVDAGDAHLLVIEVEGNTVAFRDVDGVASAFEIGHEAGVGPAGEEVFSEGGGGEALSVGVGEGESAEVGEITGFLRFEVGEEEVLDGGFPAANDASSFAVGVGFMRAVAEPGDLLVGFWDGALHAKAWDGAEFAFWGDGDVDVEFPLGSDGVGDVSGRASGGDFEVEGEGHVVCFGPNLVASAGGVGARVTPSSGAGAKLVGTIVVDGGTPKVEMKRAGKELTPIKRVGGEHSCRFANFKQELS
ncbi:MAG: hypothetical protein ACJAVK_000730 [Akkermansiaceae bacterium]